MTWVVFHLSPVWGCDSRVHNNIHNRVGKTNQSRRPALFKTNCFWWWNCLQFKKPKANLGTFRHVTNISLHCGGASQWDSNSDFSAKEMPSTPTIIPLFAVLKYGSQIFQHYSCSKVGLIAYSLALRLGNNQRVLWGWALNGSVSPKHASLEPCIAMEAIRLSCSQSTWRFDTEGLLSAVPAEPSLHIFPSKRAFRLVERPVIEWPSLWVFLAEVPDIEEKRKAIPSALSVKS